MTPAWGSRGPTTPSIRRALQSNAGELKGLDVSIDNTTLISTTSTNADIILLNPIENGNASWNRIGRKAFLKSVRLTGMLTHESGISATTLNANGNRARMLLVWDKQPSGNTLAVLSDIIGDQDAGGTETSDLFSHLKFDNTGRFSILKDIVIDMPVTSVNNRGGTEDLTVNQYSFDYYCDLKNRTSIFSGESDPITIADISTGGLYLVQRASFAALNINSVNSSGTARLRFTS